jgi:OFA family oxalate/formate antiporter-like MFS transporter
VFLLGMFLLAPSASVLASAKSALSSAKRLVHNATPREVVSAPVFWVMYLMFVMMAAGGLMATAQLGPIAKDFGLHDSPVSLLGLTLPALTFALTIDRVLNGLTRPFFGWISDRIGRENTMFIAFAIEAVGILALSKFGQSPVAFVVLTGIVFFAWGEIYSLFPATCGDTFGPKFAATNAGLLYTAKGTAALLVPFTSIVTAATGSWHAVFMLASGMAAVAAFLALFVLKPMRRAYTLQHSEASLDTPYGSSTRISDSARISAEGG